MSALKNGLVTRSTGSWYQVLTSENQSVECRIKGKFRLQGIRTTNPVVVGDHVHFETMQDSTGVIRKIEKRRNYIVRKSVNLSRQAHIIAANIDQAYLIITLIDPVTSTEFIDRFLVAAEANRVPATLVFNKLDLYRDDELLLCDKLSKVYQSIGYSCMRLCALNTEDADAFRDKLSSGMNLLAGHSGVGKSTLINVAQKDIDAKVGEISEHHREGMHTTTFAEVFPLSKGGFIIDTPGIKGFGVIDINKENMAHYFPEMFALISQCKFNNCIHINEPQCAIKNAVDSGEIAKSRYQSYLSIYQTDETETYR